MDNANFMAYNIAMTREELSLPQSRARLASVLRATNEVISVEATSKILSIDRRRAGQVLSRWRSQGWLRRIGHGLYVSVPLELSASEQVVADPWTLVPTLFGQCYVGGWTAAHHWELTEQLFNETVVFTTRRLTDNRVTAQGIVFTLRSTTPRRLFGLKALWRGAVKVNISDPARTLIDMIAIPKAGGGIDHVTDCLRTFLHTKTANRDQLIDYAEQFGNGAIFKRLGFLADRHLQDQKLATACRERLTQGYAHLDPALSDQKLITTWRLWVPTRWDNRST